MKARAGEVPGIDRAGQWGVCDPAGCCLTPGSCPVAKEGQGHPKSDEDDNPLPRVEPV
jgi:hypothetical protein